MAEHAFERFRRLRGLTTQAPVARSVVKEPVPPRVSNGAGVHSATPQQPSNDVRVAERSAATREGDKHKGVQAGDYCYLLSVDGVQKNAEPYFIGLVEAGPDGQPYARFYETDTGWPLAQCERTDAPASPPDDVEDC